MGGEFSGFASGVVDVAGVARIMDALGVERGGVAGGVGRAEEEGEEEEISDIENSDL